MTDITRVPLQPIAKGALSKLWIGIVVIALAAAGIAWAAMPVSVDVQTVTAGEGPSPEPEDWVLVNYTGTLENGVEFDKGEQAVFPLPDLVPGFRNALIQMQRGGKYEVKIPAALAYGDEEKPGIPANSDLNFEIELLDFKTKEEVEQQQRMMEQMQQMQQMQGGQPGQPGNAGPAPMPQIPPMPPQP